MERARKIRRELEEKKPRKKKSAAGCSVKISGLAAKGLPRANPLCGKESLKFFLRGLAEAKTAVTVIISVMVIAGIVKAGSLTPSSLPAATGYTLGDIYTRLTTNAAAEEGDHDFSPLAAPAASLRTLTEIYEAIPAVDAAKVLFGTTYLGIAGTYDASLIATGTVKTGVNFGVAGTGAYPSADYPLSGDTGASDAAAGQVCNSYEAWTKAGVMVAGTINPNDSSIISGTTICGVAGTAVPSPAFGDNDASKVLTTAGTGIGTYDATNLTPENVRKNIVFGVGQTGTFEIGYGYGSDNAAEVLTTAAGTPGTFSAANLDNSLIKLGTTWGVSLGQTGTLTPNGGTAAVADLFNGKTANLTGDWDLDSGTLNLACNTATFDGTGNLIANGYDGAGDGTNRWCVTNTGDAIAGEIAAGKKAWVDGIEITGDMISIGQQTITPGAANTAITAGYHDGTGYCAGDADLAAGKIMADVNIFGVSGTLLKNLYNGSATTGATDFAYYTQALGGVDDYNDNQAAVPTGAYSGGWTDCTSGADDYCGTGDANADAKDNSTGLIWSDQISDAGDYTTTWFWANNCYEPAAQTPAGVCASHGDDGCQCQKKPEGVKVGCEALGAGWRLPYQKELMQAYIDGSSKSSVSYLANTGYAFWSATTVSLTTTFAWRVNLPSGYTYSHAKADSAYLQSPLRPLVSWRRFYDFMI